MSYATRADLVRLALKASVLGEIEEVEPDAPGAALESASSLADGYLGSRFTLPLVTHGEDLTRAVCSIAAYDLMVVRGYNPEGADINLRLRYDDAIRWLERVGQGHVTPGGVTDSSATGSLPSVPFMRGPKPRGW